MYIHRFPSPKDDLCNRVDYCEFLRYLDWETNPVPIAKPSAIQVEYCNNNQLYNVFKVLNY